MKSVLCKLALISAMFLLNACGEKSQPPAPQSAPAKLFEKERGALDQAKGVSQTEAKSAEELKQETEKQTQ